MSESTLIKAARLFDGISGRLAEDRYVVIRGDAITDIGRTADLGASAVQQFGATIELQPQQTLMPGLINMHTHLSFSSGPNVFEDQVNETDAIKMVRIVENLHAALDVGITTVRDCGTWPHLALPARDAVEGGMLRGPRMVTSGAITSTGGHCWFCAIEADNEDELRKAVRTHVKDGVDFIKLFATGGNTTPGSNSLVAQYTEAQMCAATEEARKAGRRSASHAHAIEGVRTSIKARVTTIEHCSFQLDDGFGWDDDMVKEILDNDIYVCPTVFRGLAKLIGDPNHHFTAREEMFLSRRKDRFRLTRRLADIGVKLVSGNDSGVAHCHITDYPGDLVETVTECGISPAAVLRSATSVAAEALGRADLGVLAPGKAADLLVLEGDPLTDIHALEHPALVIARGRKQPFTVI
ncbi:MAG: amidohydrolase family protein [Pseudomonadota bacterium]